MRAVLSVLCRKIDSKLVLATTCMLAFVSLTTGLASTLYYEHGPVLTVIDNLPAALLLLLCAGFVLLPSTKWNKSELLIMCVSVAFLLEQVAAVHANGFDRKGYQYPVLLFAGMLGAVVAERLSRAIVISRSRSFLSKTVRLLLGYFCLEAIVRFIYSPYVQPLVSPEMGGGYGLFYRFKFSFFFMEANYVSMALLCILAAMYAYRHCFSRSEFVLAYLLLLLTFSRAAAVPALAQIIFRKWWVGRRKIAVVLSVGVICANIVMFSVYLKYPEFFHDPSFVFKLYAFSLVLEFVQHASLWQKLLGVGFGNSTNAIGMPVHTIVGTFAFEFGLLGTALFVLFIYLLARNSPKVAYYLLIPFAIYGLSIVGVATSSFLFTLGMLASTTRPTQQHDPERRLDEAQTRCPQSL